MNKRLPDLKPVITSGRRSPFKFIAVTWSAAWDSRAGEKEQKSGRVAAGLRLHGAMPP